MVKATLRSDTMRFGTFHGERTCALMLQLLQRQPVGAMLYGGYPAAERRMLCVHPKERAPQADAFPIACIGISYRRADKLTHRDVLGAVMALNLKREVIGDILLEEGHAQLFVSRAVAPVVLGELIKIGRVGVSVAEESEPIVITPQFEEICGTVASLRLDCLVSLATRQSREKAAKLIAAQAVSVGGLPLTSASAEVKEQEICPCAAWQFRLSAFRCFQKGTLIYPRYC